MTIEKYIDALNNIIKNNPEAKNYKLICSSDPEGNSFNPVNWGPTVGFYSEGGDFTPEEYFEEWQDDYEEPIKANSICVN
jgi:hypothetical protein